MPAEARAARDDGLPHIEVKHCDLSADMQELAVKLGIEAVTTMESESQMATFIKKEFDSKYDGKWHCIVGRAYGCFVTHDAESFIYLEVGNEVILLFKST